MKMYSIYILYINSPFIKDTVLVRTYPQPILLMIATFEHLHLNIILYTYLLYTTILYFTLLYKTLIYLFYLHMLIFKYELPIDNNDK
jgi:hypothetical protein